MTASWPIPGMPYSFGTSSVGAMSRTTACESVGDVSAYERTGSPFGLTITATTFFAAGIVARTSLIAWFTYWRSARGSVGSNATISSAEPWLEVELTDVTEGSDCSACSSGRVTAMRT